MRAMQNNPCTIKKINNMSSSMIKPSLPEVVDGCTSEGAIVKKFKVHMKYYNKNAAEDEVFKFTERTEKLITLSDVATVCLIDGKVLK